MIVRCSWGSFGVPNGSNSGADALLCCRSSGFCADHVRFNFWVTLEFAMASLLCSLVSLYTHRLVFPSSRVSLRLVFASSRVFLRLVISSSWFFLFWSCFPFHAKTGSMPPNVASSTAQPPNLHVPSQFFMPPCFDTKSLWPPQWEGQGEQPLGRRKHWPWRSLID